MRKAIGTALCVFGALAAAAMPLSAQQIVRQPAKPDFNVNGPDNFRQYCAPCHGTDAKGNGPAAKALKTPPADLTMIAKRNGGRFPEDAVRDTIIGEQPLPSHGNREMPIWGIAFYNMSGKDAALYNRRLDNLVNYLRSIQAKP